MTDMTGLRASILEESHEKGRHHLAAAKEKIHTELEQKKTQLLLEKEAYRMSQLNDINRRVQREKQQLENQARQSTLTTKQAVLKELFLAAEAQMTAWSEGEHLSFLKSVLKSYQDPITVQFGQLTAEKLSEDTWASLIADYPNAHFERKSISHEAGFLIIRGQIDDNYLYSSLVTGLWESESFRLASDIFQAD